MKLPRHYQDGGPSVEFYDLLVSRRGAPVAGDIEFYLAQARRIGGPVLDLACGTGRVAFPVAISGFPVTGVERAPAMLAIARAKQRASGLNNLKFVRGNMADFDLSSRFGLAIIAFRAFQHLLTPREQRSCLECVRRHLRRRGRVVVHLFDPKLEHCIPTSRPLSTNGPKIHDPASGQDFTVEVIDRQTDPVTQVFSEVWRWTVTDEGSSTRTRDDVLRLRWTYRYEMRYLLELAGFRVRGEYGDFKGSPPRYGAEQVWVAEAV